MGIEKQNPYCSLCKNNIKTLTHIFSSAHCCHTLCFTKRLRLSIQMKIDPQYRDHKNVYYITCSHDNLIIYYLNIAAIWYISKQFQSGQALLWEGFKRLVQLALNGEKFISRTI